jgi:hypothetical protein
VVQRLRYIFLAVCMLVRPQVNETGKLACTQKSSYGPLSRDDVEVSGSWAGRGISAPLISSEAAMAA